MSTAGRAPAGARILAWAGTLVFFASLAYFLSSYLTTFARPAPPGPVLRPIAIDVLLFTAFAFHHSLFARERVRAAVSRAMSPFVERSFYVWVASALFVAVVAWWRPVPGVAWETTGVVRWLLIALQAAGAWLTVRSAMIIDVLELSGVRQLSPRPRAAVFRTAGPYGWMRHPIYTGWLLLVLCMPTMTMTQLVFAVVSAAYLMAAIPLEERSLHAMPGDPYAAYAARVRWKLLPGIY